MSNSNSVTDLTIVNKCLENHEKRIEEEARVIEEKAKKANIVKPSLQKPFTFRKVRHQQKTSSFTCPTRADLDRRNDKEQTNFHL